MVVIETELRAPGNYSKGLKELTGIDILDKAKIFITDNYSVFTADRFSDEPEDTILIRRARLYTKDGKSGFNLTVKYPTQIPGQFVEKKKELTQDEYTDEIGRKEPIVTVSGYRQECCISLDDLTEVAGLQKRGGIIHVCYDMVNGNKTIDFTEFEIETHIDGEEKINGVDPKIGENVRLIREFAEKVGVNPDDLTTKLYPQMVLEGKITGY